MRKILFLALTVLLLLTGPCSALIYTGLVSDPVGMDIDAYSIIVAEGTSPSALKHFYWDGGGSAALAMFNISNYCEDVAVFGNYYFIVLTDGRVYRITKPTGLVNFGLYSTSKLYLGDVDAASRSRCIAVDGAGNVYVAGGDTLWKFTYPAYTMSSVWTLTAPRADQIQSLANHPDGLLLGCGKLAGGLAEHKVYVFLWNGSTATELFTHSSGWPYHSDVAENTIPGMYATSNGDVYFVHAGHWADTNGGGYGSSYWKDIKVLKKDEAYAATTLATLSVYYTDMVIDPSGIIYISSSATDTLDTYATLGAIGGYVPVSPAGSGSSGSSGAVNPLLDLDGDGEFTQDDAKDMALTLGPATWIFMFMIFLMVAMSAGGRRR